MRSLSTPIFYFTRHGEALQNSVDSPLSTVGRHQSSLLTGHYDKVICSPLRRCLETLHYSKITYNELMINHLFRERIHSEGSMLLFEHANLESHDDLNRRCEKFQKELDKIMTDSTILLIGHSQFVDAWLHQSLKSKNAEIVPVTIPFSVFN